MELIYFIPSVPVSIPISLTIGCHCNLDIVAKFATTATRCNRLAKGFRRPRIVATFATFGTIATFATTATR